MGDISTLITCTLIPAIHTQIDEQLHLCYYLWSVPQTDPCNSRETPRRSTGCRQAPQKRPAAPSTVSTSPQKSQPNSRYHPPVYAVAAAPPAHGILIGFRHLSEGSGCRIMRRSTGVGLRN